MSLGARFVACLLTVRASSSDSLQAAAIAGATDQTGAQRVTIVYVDDSYGRPFAEAVKGLSSISRQQEPSGRMA